MKNLIILATTFALLKFYSLGVGTTCRWHIEYQNLDNGKILVQEVPLKQVIIKVDPIVEFNQETYDPKTKTVVLTTARFN